MIGVVIADDQPVVRAGVSMLLEAAGDIRVLAEVADGQAAVDAARRHHPDVVIMDVRMPGLDGVEATRVLTADPDAAQPDQVIRVLILTTFDDDEIVYGALSAGASGFLLKYAAPQVLVDAVRRVASGGAWLDQEIAAAVITALARSPQNHPVDSTLINRLTARERQILVLMADGLTNRDICGRLVLTEATVKTHVSRVLMKTGSHDRAQAVALAYKSGLVQVHPARHRHNPGKGSSF